MFGFQAAGSAPIVLGEVVKDPDTIASAIRIGNPASWELALTARDETDGYFGAIDDADILEAHRILSSEVGIFVEPASAISVAGLLERAEAGRDPEGLDRRAHRHRPRPEGPAVGAARPPTAADVTPTSVAVDVAEIAGVLGLSAVRA